MFKHIITAMLTVVLGVSLFGAAEPVVNAKAAQAPAAKKQQAAAPKKEALDLLSPRKQPRKQQPAEAAPAAAPAPMPAVAVGRNLRGSCFCRMDRAGLWPLRRILPRLPAGGNAGGLPGVAAHRREVPLSPVSADLANYFLACGKNIESFSENLQISVGKIQKMGYNENASREKKERSCP